MVEWKGDVREFGKIPFDFVLMTYIQDINKQLAKLPHESIMQNLNEPVGTTYNDIVQSYCNMVAQLSQLLKPYWDEEYILLDRSCASFAEANTTFGCLMQLCDRRGFLFSKIRSRVSAESSYAD